jgi:hypothetical protein
MLGLWSIWANELRKATCQTLYDARLLALQALELRAARIQNPF